MQNSSLHFPSNIAIVILSCDKFKITWKPCIDHLVNAWPNCPYPIYLLNNFIPSNDDRVIDLLVGDDLNWSDSLKKGLIKLQEKRVFFIYDDSFISYININVVEEIFETAFILDLESVTLRKNPFDNGIKYNDLLYKLRPDTRYRNSLFINLLKKDVLLTILKSGENAWQFEKDGNRRSSNFDFYSVKKVNLMKYHHGIVKGKWLPATKKYLKQKGYDLDDERFKTFSFFQMISMNIYFFIHTFGNKLVHKINNLF